MDELITDQEYTYLLRRGKGGGAFRRPAPKGLTSFRELDGKGGVPRFLYPGLLFEFLQHLPELVDKPEAEVDRLFDDEPEVVEHRWALLRGIHFLLSAISLAFIIVGRKFLQILLHVSLF